MGRPKSGRKRYSHSFSLTREQIEFLSEFPNSSEIIRKLIDELMELHGEIEPKLSIIAMSHEIEMLEQREHELVRERADYEKRHWIEMYSSLQLIDVPKVPRKTMEARYHRKVLKGYEKSIYALRSKIKDLRDRVLKAS